MATSFVSITDFGARGDGRTDNTAAIQRAFDTAKAAGKSVYIPEGVFAHAGVLRADGVSIDGAGAKSVLHATNASKSALFVTGDGVKVTDMTLSSVSGTRISSYDASGLVMSGTKNFLVENVTVKGPCGAGIILHGASYGTVKGSTVMDTGADSIHMVAKSNHLTITGNNVIRSGDDGISVVSYQKHGGPVSDIVVSGNSVQGNDWARGLSVVGGQNVQLLGNFVKSTADHAGVYIAQETSYQTFGVSNVLVKGNHLVDTGGMSTGQGAITIYNAGGADVRGITVTGNIVDDSRKTAVVVNGSRVDGVKIADNGFDGGKVSAVFVMNGAKNVALSGNAWHDFPKFVETYNEPWGNIAQSGNYAGVKPPLPPVGTVVTAPTTEAPEPVPVPVPAPAPSKADAIELLLSAQSYKGDPKFQLQVDGKDVGAVQTVTVQKGAGWQSFKFAADVADGGGKVSVKFLNDLYVAGQGDRTLYLDKLLVNGKVVTDVDTTMGRNGTYDFAVPAALATLPVTTAPAPQPAPAPAPAPAPTVDTIVVKAATQSWNGDAQFRLLADGKQIGAVQTVTTDLGQGWQAFTFRTDLSDATKTLGIEFLNDAWGGSAGKDRNLHVDAIMVNGVAEKLASSVFSKNGVQTVDVSEHAFDGVMHDASQA
ncbi:MAG: carbohydrate-binding domain-containing protein [Rhodospirillales bacterium]|jgi:hypothetical protein